MVKGDARRGLLLAVGMCAGFGAFWLLLVNTGLVLVMQRTSKPVLGFQTVASYANNEIQLPYMIPGTPLVAEQIVSYDGPFMEDGSEREVINVTALRLHNAGIDGIENAQIIMERGNRQLVFELDTLPPGGTVLVLEKSATAYSVDSCTSCHGWVTLSEKQWSVDALLISEADMGTLEITNTTEEALYNLRLYYKNCLTGANLYVGGKTYCVGIACLEPGKTLLLFPSHYARGYSRIVRISLSE